MTSAPLPHCHRHFGLMPPEQLLVESQGNSSALSQTGLLQPAGQTKRTTIASSQELQYHFEVEGLF